MTQLDAVKQRMVEAVKAEWIDTAASAMSWPRETLIEALTAMNGDVIGTWNMMHDYCEYVDLRALSNDDHKNFLRYLYARLSDTRPESIGFTKRDAAEIKLVRSVKHRMFTDAEVQAVQPNVALSVLRDRLEAVGFNLGQLRIDVENAIYRVYDKQGEDEIVWPDDTVARWKQRFKP